MNEGIEGVRAEGKESSGDVCDLRDMARVCVDHDKSGFARLGAYG